MDVFELMTPPARPLCQTDKYHQTIDHIFQGRIKMLNSVYIRKPEYPFDLCPAVTCLIFDDDWILECSQCYVSRVDRMPIACGLTHFSHYSFCKFDQRIEIGYIGDFIAFHIVIEKDALISIEENYSNKGGYRRDNTLKILPRFKSYLQPMGADLFIDRALSLL